MSGRASRIAATTRSGRSLPPLMFTIIRHLLLIENKPLVEKGGAWFLRPAYDGYTSGRGRDLTADPKTPNNLTLVEQAVTASRQPLAFRSGIPLAVQSLSENGALLGYVTRPAAGGSLLSVRHPPAQGVVDTIHQILVRKNKPHRSHLLIAPHSSISPSDVAKEDVGVLRRSGMLTEAPQGLRRPQEGL